MLVRGEFVLAPTNARSQRSEESAEGIYGVEGVSTVIREGISVEDGCSSKGMFDSGR